LTTFHLYLPYDEMKRCKHSRESPALHLYAA
jgi:hypothetical protein